MRELFSSCWIRLYLTVNRSKQIYEDLTGDGSKLSSDAGHRVGLALAAGVWWIRQRNIKGHARWMAQMVVLTLSPVLLRLMAAVVVMNWPRDFNFYYAVIAWICWLLPLLALRLWYWWRDWVRGLERAAAAQG